MAEGSGRHEAIDDARSTTGDRERAAFLTVLAGLARRWRLTAGIVVAVGAGGGGTATVVYGQSQSWGRAVVDLALGDPTKAAGEDGAALAGSNAAKLVALVQDGRTKAEMALAISKDNSSAILAIAARLDRGAEEAGADVCVAIGGLLSARPHPSPSHPGQIQRTCVPLDEDYQPTEPLPLADIEALRTIQAAQLRAAAAKAVKAARRRSGRR